MHLGNEKLTPRLWSQVVETSSRWWTKGCFKKTFDLWTFVVKPNFLTPCSYISIFSSLMSTQLNDFSCLQICCTHTHEFRNAVQQSIASELSKSLQNIIFLLGHHCIQLDTVNKRQQYPKAWQYGTDETINVVAIKRKECQLQRSYIIKDTQRHSCCFPRDFLSLQFSWDHMPGIFCHHRGWPCFLFLLC